MSASFYRKWIIAALATGISISSFFCADTKEETSETSFHSEWLNVYDTSVHYVGINTCKGCHLEIYNTFIQTGMGQSFDHATRQKSAADFDHKAIVYDKDLDFYYKPFWQNDSLYFMEYRLAGKDTVHKLVRKIDYIIGSGQHTNSHLYNENGYLYQAPITFYTQKRKWDLAPGFEKGASNRFARMIENECMTCHNGYPQIVAGSQNKYVSLKTGIDCERCHGPGSLHVAEKQAGHIVDTSKIPDYTIVNPRRLSTDLQNNICQRCHLQGVAVLNDGKSFFDFRPGMHLSEVMNVFMPQYEGAEDKMIMASHVERMKKSDCYVSSGKMSCITCHNPHISVKFTVKEQYLNACKSCHGGAQQIHCSEKENVRLAKNDDCVTCHMPRNGSIDIPHVAVTDHYIRRKPENNNDQSKISAFLGLKCFNNDTVDAISTARAYMEFFEKFNPNKGLLDSALFYLNKQQQKEQEEKQNRDFVHLYFLWDDFNKVASYAASLKPENINDAWAAYRMAEAYTQLQQFPQALAWYKRATELMPYSLDFQTKYATCLWMNNQPNEAEKVFRYVLNENPFYINAHINLGYLYMQQGNNTMAYSLMQKAKELAPDDEQNLINLAIWFHHNQQNDLAREMLTQLIKKHPGNEQGKAMLMDLDRRN